MPRVTESDLTWIPERVLDAIATYFLVKENAEGFFKVDGLKDEVIGRITIACKGKNIGYEIIPGVIHIWHANAGKNNKMLHRWFVDTTWRMGGTDDWH